MREALSNAGFTIPDAELGAISDAMFGITIDGDAAYPSRRSIQYTYLKVLRDAAGPISAEEMARRVNEVDPTIAATKRNVVAHFQRDRQAFSHSRGKWVHEEFLPISRSELEALAKRCLPDIQAAGGHAVSVRLLLDRLVADGRASQALSPYMLRDALIFTGKVRGWRSGTDVAWLGAEITRTGISEWLEQVAAEREQPFSMAELIHAVVERSGYLASSIAVQAYGEHSTLIPVGRGQFVSKQCVWPDASEYALVIQRVRDAVHRRGILSAEDPKLRLDGLEREIARFGTGIVWGLASVSHQGIATRERGLLMWASPSGQSLWSVIAQQVLAEHPLLEPAMLRDHLFERGLRSLHVVHSLLQEGVARSHVWRVGTGWYLDRSIAFDRQVELLDQEPALRQLALGSQDFVRESPLRMALNEVRVRHARFRVPEA